MADELKEIREQLRRIEKHLDVIGRRVHFIFWVLILVLTWYLLGLLFSIFGVVYLAAPQYFFPIAVVVLSILFFAIKRNPEP